MGERRQAARREPITVVLDDGREFEARPLPWMEANDLGDEILRQNAEGVNESVRMYMKDEIPQLEMSLGRKITDWHRVLVLAYPQVDPSLWTEPRVLDIDECSTLILAALEVNHLTHINHLVDPNSQTPTLPGGIVSSAAGTEDGEKTTSTEDSVSSDSPELSVST